MTPLRPLCVSRPLGAGAYAHPLMRVVSLLPSATEMFLLLTGPEGLGGGLGARSGSHSGIPVLVGRSHECDFAPFGVAESAGASDGIGLGAVPVLTSARTHFQTSAQVDREVREALASGRSLYDLDATRLASLKPDLILTQDLCDVCSIDLGAVRRAAQGLSPPPRILSLNPRSFEDVNEDVLRIGGAAGLEDRALRVVLGLRERLDRAQELVPAFAPRVRVGFLEWTDPLFVAGHWTPQIIERAGGEHPLNPSVALEGAGAADGVAGQSQRRAGKSIAVPPEVFGATQPEFLFIAPCGLSLEASVREARRLAGQPWFESLPAVRHDRRASGAPRLDDEQAEGGSAGRRWLRGEMVRAGPPRVWCVDGNQMFNRPSTRLVDALEFVTGVLQDRPEHVPRDFPARSLLV